MRSRIVLVLLSGFLVLGLATSAAGYSLYVDDFPLALPRYITGGWRGPFGDGTGGTTQPTSDQTGIFMDGTYNALAYAIRRSSEMTDVNLTVDFAILGRDMTEADQFSLLLAWRNSSYPEPSSCSPCTGPTPESGIVVNFNIGRSSVRVSEVTNFTTTEVTLAPSALTAGRAHEARVDFSHGTVSVYLDSVRELTVDNLTKPAGTVGFIAYRVDVAVDSVRFDVPQSATASLSASPISPWIIAILAGVTGAALVAVGSGRARKTKSPPDQP